MRTDMSIDQIRCIIDKADIAYYGHTAILSDAEYDKLKAHLRELDPNDERLTRVGMPYSDIEIGGKIEHPIPMGSLENVKDGIAGFDKWYTSIGCPEMMASLKMDGSSIRARYENGKLVSVVTRGNGHVGENILNNGIRFIGLPLSLPRPVTIDVRGEAMLYTKDFQSLMEKEHGLPFADIELSKLSNPRNVGNGIVSRDDGKNAEFIRFVAFNVYANEEFGSEDEKYSYLESLGFECVSHKLCKTLDDVMEYYAEVEKNRDGMPFEIDGIVTCINSVEKQQSMPGDRLRPKYARAVKFDTKTAITEIIGVNITVGHTGAIIPTAILKTVRIGGVNVSNALLNNWDEIAHLDCAIGDKVVVGLAGDIIPKILRVVERTPCTYKCEKCGMIGTYDELSVHEGHHG